MHFFDLHPPNSLPCQPNPSHITYQLKPSPPPPRCSHANKTPPISFTSDVEEHWHRDTCHAVNVSCRTPVRHTVLYNDGRDSQDGLGTPRHPASVLQGHVSLAPLEGLDGGPSHTITGESCTCSYRYQTRWGDGHTGTGRWH